MSYLVNFKEIANSKIKKDEEDKETRVVPKTITAKNEIGNELMQKDNNKVVTNSNQSNNQNNISENKYNADINDNPEEKLKELDEKIALIDFFDAPSSLGLTKKEKPVYDEEKVKNDLIKVLEGEKEQEKSNINLEFEDNKNKLEQEKSNMQKLKDENETKINNIYDSESLSIERQAIKRGLARSSIVLGQLAKIENDRASELINNMNNISSKIDNIEDDIQKNIIARDNALKNLDLDYAEEIEEKLEESKAEYKKTVDEVIEFNNNVDKLEAEYKIKYENAKQDWTEGVIDLNQKGYDGYRQKIANAKYDYMTSYLSLFDKDEAIKLLTGNPNLKKLLGSDYERVYEYIINK